MITIAYQLWSSLLLLFDCLPPSQLLPDRFRLSEIRESPPVTMREVSDKDRAG